MLNVVHPMRGVSFTWMPLVASLKYVLVLWPLADSLCALPTTACSARPFLFGKRVMSFPVVDILQHSIARELLCSHDWQSVQTVCTDWVPSVRISARSHLWNSAKLCSRNNSRCALPRATDLCSCHENIAQVAAREKMHPPACVVQRAITTDGGGGRAPPPQNLQQPRKDFRLFHVKDSFPNLR